MNLYGEMFGNKMIFEGQEFASNNEAYNFYNAYVRNRRFGVRKKGIDKSRRPLYEVICKKILLQ